MSRSLSRRRCWSWRLALFLVHGAATARPGSWGGMMERFTGSFTQQEPIPEEGIAAALDVLRHGRLHRYNTAPGEVAETALLEEEFAAFTGARYCLAVASGGYAMATALRAVGVGHGRHGAVERLHAGAGAGGDCRGRGACRCSSR